MPTVGSSGNCDTVVRDGGFCAKSNTYGALLADREGELFAARCGADAGGGEGDGADGDAQLVSAGGVRLCAESRTGHRDGDLLDRCRTGGVGDASPHGGQRVCGRLDGCEQQQCGKRDHALR